MKKKSVFLKRTTVLFAFLLLFKSSFASLISNDPGEIKSLILAQQSGFYTWLWQIFMIIFFILLIFFIIYIVLKFRRMAMDIKSMKKDTEEILSRLKAEK